MHDDGHSMVKDTQQTAKHTAQSDMHKQQSRQTQCQQHTNTNKQKHNKTTKSKQASTNNKNQKRQLPVCNILRPTRKYQRKNKKLQ